MSVASSSELQGQLDAQRRRVDVDFYDITVRELQRMTIEGEIVRAPAYQRKFRWDASDESKLIESIFLGFPVPSIFVAANADGTWELVDGLQRVSTLLHFLSDESDAVLKEIARSEPLKLVDLQKLSTFNGSLFSQLSTQIQLHFLKRSLRVTVLTDKSDAAVRFDTFERLNNGGVSLTHQEVRACVYQGKFMDFVRDVANVDEFKSLLKLSKGKRNDGTYEEVVVKFFAYLNHRSHYRNNLKSFLNDYTERANKEFDVTGGRRLFDGAVRSMSGLLDGKPFLRQEGRLYVSPLTQFEAAMVGIAELLQEGRTPIPHSKQWIDDLEFVQAAKGGSNAKTKLESRIRRAKELLSGAPADLGGTADDPGDH